MSTARDILDEWRVAPCEFGCDRTNDECSSKGPCKSRINARADNERKTKAFRDLTGSLQHESHES